MPSIKPLAENEEVAAEVAKLYAQIEKDVSVLSPSPGLLFTLSYRL